MNVAAPPTKKTAPPDNRSVDVVTLGCRLNLTESEAVAGLAQEAGLSNAVIINTCAVTQEAVRQARQAIRRARRERPDAAIIVTGCAAQIEPEAFSAMPEVNHVIGNAEKTAAETYQALVAGQGGRVQAGDIMQVRKTAPHLTSAFSDRARAYVEVQNGCDHRCTFCTIPYGRGNSRSSPAGGVVEQVARLAASGHQEVVLTGVDLTSWGEDLPGRPRLGNLVSRLLKFVPELPMLRLSSLDVIEMDEQLFALLATEPRIAPHLHLSLQHGHDLILKRMKRRHSRADAVALASRLKKARPDIALGADLIAGFPTETEEHFEAMMSLIEDAQLSYVHVFPFSPRKGTPAARMPQVARDVIKARAARLRERGEHALRRHLDNWIGRESMALVEKPGVARLDDFTVAVVPEALPTGQRLRLRITGQDGARLSGVAA